MNESRRPIPMFPSKWAPAPSFLSVEHPFAIYGQASPARSMPSGLSVSCGPATIRSAAAARTGPRSLFYRAIHRCCPERKGMDPGPNGAQAAALAGAQNSSYPGKAHASPSAAAQGYRLIVGHIVRAGSAQPRSLYSVSFQYSLRRTRHETGRNRACSGCGAEGRIGP